MSARGYVSTFSDIRSALVCFFRHRSWIHTRIANVPIYHDMASENIIKRGTRGGGHGGGGGGGGHGTPENDPGVASSAIVPLSCGLLILTTRHPQQA